MGENSKNQVSGSHYKALDPDLLDTLEGWDHLGFCRATAIKHIVRAGSKGDAYTDICKAIQYLERWKLLHCTEGLPLDAPAIADEKDPKK